MFTVFLVYSNFGSSHSLLSSCVIQLRNPVSASAFGFVAANYARFPLILAFHFFVFFVFFTPLGFSAFRLFDSSAFRFSAFRLFGLSYFLLFFFDFYHDGGGASADY